MASRGSVIPLFLEQINNDIPITITNPEMTRFMMSLQDAVELVLYAFEFGNNGDIFIQKSPAATIDVLAKSIVQLTNKTEHPIEYIGTRHGEKQHETLLTCEEMSRALDEGDYYRVPADERDLNYSQSAPAVLAANRNQEIDYNSHNTHRLSIDEMKSLLLKLPEFKSFL
jgi:UDP-glucose 4-epimerase